MNKNENTTYPNFRDEVKATIKRKFIGITAYVKKKKISSQQLNFTTLETRKRKTKSKDNRRKEIIKISLEIIKIENKKQRKD